MVVHLPAFVDAARLVAADDSTDSEHWSAGVRIAVGAAALAVCIVAFGGMGRVQRWTKSHPDDEGKTAAGILACVLFGIGLFAGFTVLAALTNISPFSGSGGN